MKSEKWRVIVENRFAVFFLFFYLLPLISSLAKLCLALVGLDGLEPSTSRLSGARSNHLSYKPLLLCWFFPIFPPVCSLLLFLFIFALWKVKSEKWRVKRCVQTSLNAGGDDGIRTHDPLLAGQVLSQLSYTPIPRALFFFQGSFRSLKIEQQKICTQPSVYRPRRLVWQDRDILSRSP